MQANERIGEWVRSLNAHHANLRIALEPEAVEAEWQPAVRELQAFLDQVASTLMTLDQAVTKMGVKEALHVLQLRRLTELMEAQNGDVQRLGSAVEELAQGVTRVAEDTHQAAEAAGRMREAGSDSLEVIGRVLQSIGALESQAKEAQSSVLNLVEQTRAAAEGLRAIQGVAATSKLLALNAAIQAAHVNDRAFAVVAQEMRRLSDRTEHLVKQIEGQVTGMEQAITVAAAAMQSMADKAGSTGEQANHAASGLEAVQSLLNQVSEAVESIAAVAEEQAASTEEMAATAQDLSGRVQAAAESMNLTRNLAISEVTEQAQEALGRFYIGSQTDRVRSLMERACAQVEETTEQLVAQGRVRFNDLWDYNYQEIKGGAIQSLSRIFRVDRVPAQGFKPAKYMTRYDQQIDLPLIDLMDQVIAQGRVQFCTVLDLNAYTAVHGRNMAQDWTGDFEQDLRTNRIKRLFTFDANARKGSRVGLPASLVNKELIKGTDLAGLPGPGQSRPFLLQTYALDSGEVVLAMSMPLFVNGKRWATLRVGYQPEVGSV
ncbi:MAG: methyl-accepting chemotaxis protein [Bacillota bacterium]